MPRFWYCGSVSTFEKTMTSCFWFFLSICEHDTTTPECLNINKPTLHSLSFAFINFSAVTSGSMLGLGTKAEDERDQLLDRISFKNRANSGESQFLNFETWNTIGALLKNGGRTNSLHTDSRLIAG
jgi:hypothetical protein